MSTGNNLETFADNGGQLPKVVGVSLQAAGRIYNYLAGSNELRRGERVVVPAEGGNRIGTVEIESHEPAAKADASKLKSVVRIANENDLRAEGDNLDREIQARRLCLEKIRDLNMPIKLINIAFALDGRKATIYFAAEERVDFREFVRAMAGELRVRLEMKQVGARDESKAASGIGPCGRELCCSSWLREFEGVTVKMAREQGLALNPSRLAGMCGRLKCCLRYEYATYVELKRSLPAVGKRAQSVKGDGKVIRQNIFTQTVTIKVDGEDGLVEAGLEDLVDRRRQ